jgi:CubicO group peptidase (beta-lactamase class C family)
MKKLILGIFLILAGAAGGFWATADDDMKALVSSMPTDANVLFWNTAQRDAAFRAMDRIPILAKSNIIESGDDVYPLPKGAPIKIATDVDAYMKAQRTAGLVIIQDGKIRLEKYGLGFTGNGKWTSFSVAKSFTSTLVGAAIKDGYIKSIDDKVSAYIPDLEGSAYDDVTIRQLLTMTSGVKWNEDYADPKSDVALFNQHKAKDGMDVTVSYMRTLPREAPAGTKWVYKTGETNLIGVLVSSATKKNLSEYLSEKIWVPFGMEQDGSWLLGSTGHEISGCCIQASTRDYARFGLFMMGGAMVKGVSILPDDWIVPATTKQADIGAPGKGYGYQWWTYDDGSYAASRRTATGLRLQTRTRLESNAKPFIKQFRQLWMQRRNR